MQNTYREYRYTLYSVLLRAQRKQGDDPATLATLVHHGGRLADIAGRINDGIPLLDVVAGRWVRGKEKPRGTPWAARLIRGVNASGQATYVVETGFYENYPRAEVLLFNPYTKQLEGGMS